MSKNQIQLKGFAHIFELLTSWMKTKEEKELFEALTAKKKVEAVQIVSRETTDRPIREVDVLDKIVEMYERLGYPVSEIREMVEPKIENILAVFACLQKLKQFENRGMIVESRVHKIDRRKKKRRQKDRRRERRYPIETEVSYRILDQWYQGHLCNISQSGAQILACNSCNSDQTAEIRLRNFDNSQLVSIPGTIVWWQNTRTKGDIRDYTCRLGLHFEKRLTIPPSSFLPQA